MKSAKSILNQKALKYLGWVGPLVMVAGLSAGGVMGQWGVVPLAIIGVGLLMTIAWLVVQSNGMKGFWGQRSTQVSTNALVATVAVLAIFFLVNFLANRYNTRLDLTENQLFTLAPQTQEVVQSLNAPVRVVIFDVVPNPQDRDLLENYRRQNPQLTYAYVDPQAQPGVAEAFGVQTFGEVYLEQGDRRQQVQTLSADQRLSERRLTNALVQLTSDRQVKVYFVQGHGERSLEAGQGGLSQASSSLNEENYTPESLNLADRPTVPEDAAVVVLAGPQRPLLEEEVEALRTYTRRRSGLLVMVDPQVNPELNALLQDWGVGFSDRILVDPDAGRDGVVTIVTQYGQHPITQQLGNGISFYPLARPLELGEADGVDAVPLLITNDSTQAQRVGEDGQLRPDPATDLKGSLVLGAAFSRPVRAEAVESAPDEASGASPSPSPTPADPPSGESRLVAIGNSSFISDGLINQQLNRDVFLNAVAWLSQEDTQTLAIRPAEPTNRRVTLSLQQQVWLALGTMALLPLVGFLAAIGVWWKRR